MTWKKAPLGSFCRTGSGTTPPRTAADRYYGGSIPWVKSGELREAEIFGTSESVTETALRETSLRLVPSGAILIAMYGATVGRVGMLRIDATTNQAICHIVPDPKVADNRFVYHCLAAHAPYFISRGAGGAQPNITQRIVQDFEMVLPPLAEQQRIAAILDQADNLQRKRRESIELLRALPQALFRKVIKQTNPRSLRIGDFCQTGSGATPARSKSQRYYDGGTIPWVKSGELRESEIRSTAEMVTPAALAETSLTLLDPGTLMLAMYGATIGRVGLLRTSATTNQAVCHIVPDPTQADKIFVYYGLQSLAPEFIRRGAGGAQPNINQGIIQDTVMMLPSLEEQRAFAHQIDMIDAVRREAEASLGMLEALFRSLQMQLLSGNMSDAHGVAALAV